MQCLRSLTRAVDGAGLGHHDDGHGVGEEDADEQDVAELPARGHDDGRVVVVDEDEDDLDGDGDAERGEQRGEEDPGRVPVERLGVEQQALVLGVARHVAEGTLRAQVLLQHHRVLAARHAHPAASVLGR